MCKCSPVGHSAPISITGDNSGESSPTSAAGLDSNQFDQCTPTSIRQHCLDRSEFDSSYRSSGLNCNTSSRKAGNKSGRPVYHRVLVELRPMLIMTPLSSTLTPQPDHKSQASKVILQNEPNPVSEHLPLGLEPGTYALFRRHPSPATDISGGRQKLQKRHLACVKDVVPSRHSASYSSHRYRFDPRHPVIRLEPSRGECRDDFEHLIGESPDVQNVRPLGGLRGPVRLYIQANQTSQRIPLTELRPLRQQRRSQPAPRVHPRLVIRDEDHQVGLRLLLVQKTDWSAAGFVVTVPPLPVVTVVAPGAPGPPGSPQ